MKFNLMIVLLCVALPLHASLFTAKNADEVKKFSKRLQPGDTLVLSDGGWRDAALSIEANGTEARPIVIRSQTPGKVEFTGTSSLGFSGSWITVSGVHFVDGAIAKGAVISFRTSSEKAASNCRLTDCAIIEYNPTDKLLDYKWVSLYGRNNRVDHCTFIGKRNQGTLLVVWLDSLPNGHRIDHNYFGPRPEHGQNGAEIIRVGTSEWSMSTSHTTVEYNVFEQCNGEIEIISNKSCENVYRYNTFLACAGTLTLRHGNRNEVYGNFFFGDHRNNTGGVRIIGEDQTVRDNWFQELAGKDRFAPLALMDGVKDTPLNGYFQVKRAVARHNIFVSCGAGIVCGTRNTDYSGFVPAENVTFAANLFYEIDTPVTFLSTPVDLAASDNVVSGSSSKLPEGFTAGLAEQPTIAQLLLWLKLDNRGRGAGMIDPTERIPVEKERVGVSWKKEE
jgi:poly(beta-D-mannuronate) lyase